MSQPAETGFGPLLTRAAATLQQQAESAGVVLRITPPETPVEADSAPLLDALVLLIEAAIRVSPPGATVAVDAQTIAGDLLIWVRDEGQGIETERIEAIFKPQAGSEDEDLPRAWRLVVAMGGSLWAESMPPHGTTYVIRLPASR